jgi:hypothetical protein
MLEKGNAIKRLSGAAGVRLKGYNINSVAGVVETTINQPGNMRALLGVALYPTLNPALNLFNGTYVTLNINSELVFDAIPALAIYPLANPQGNIFYFPVFRNLMGNDSILFTMQSTSSNPYSLVVYFRP